MQLTKFSDYSLRVLMYLSANPNSTSTVKELAAIYELSQNHMVKVVHTLSNLGYLNTTKGRGGGVKLAKNAEDINLGTLIRKLEHNVTLVECFSSTQNTCKITSACGLKHIFSESLDAFFTTLDQYTLADTVPNKTKLNKLLVVT